MSIWANGSSGRLARERCAPKPQDRRSLKGRPGHEDVTGEHGTRARRSNRRFKMLFLRPKTENSAFQVFSFKSC